MSLANTQGSGPIVGSGDFLKDRGYLDPDEVRLKFALANEIALIIEPQADGSGAGRRAFPIGRVSHREWNRKGLLGLPIDASGDETWEECVDRLH